jgi:hypothetical protein
MLRPSTPHHAIRPFTPAGTRGLVAAALVASAGCHSWQRRPLPADAPPAVSRGRPVRVVRADQSTLELARPAIVGDSLVGEAGTPPVRTAVALRDIRRLDERRVSAARTGGLVAGSAGIVFLLLIAAATAAALSAW